jgi:hypothetical protein
MRRVVLTLAGCAAALVALVTPAAGDPLANGFTANIAPGAVRPLSAESYVVQVTNLPQSDSTANIAHVVVPAGFVVDPISLTATTSAAGNCSAATWAVTLNVGTSTIDALAPDAAGELCPGAMLTLTFGAIAPSAEGAYTWTPTLLHDATDFGLQGPAPDVAVDGTPPPSPTITSAPPGVSGSSSASFTFTDGDGGATFQCRLDGAAFSACTSPINYGGLGEGTHTFDVTAVDPAGNQSSVTTYSWTIDLTNPVVTINPASEPPDPTNSTSASFVFTSNKPGSTFECHLDGSAFSPCSSPAAYTGLANGRHSFGVRATDSLGHVGLASTYTWQVATFLPPDVTPPGPVSGVRRIVGYRRLKLTWALPPDPDFAFVRVLRSRSPKAPAQTVVYQGKAASYSDARFQNGTYYRYMIEAYDTSGNGSALVRAVVPPGMLLRSPRNGQTVKAPPLFLWAGAPRATYYNVQVYRGGQKVLSAWPSKAKLKMHRTWTYNGHRFRLRKGGYRWWVWPGFGPRSKAAYGQLLGTGTFTVR